MTCKVLRPFRDLTDNEKPYRQGDSYSHEDEKRIAFLVEKGFIEKPKEKPKKQVKKKSDK